ncbi:hypothetical protein HY636_01240 [Candidatus Woesearchaeota archaeon]|nr:hypothetical protein [Candidatus Woesearchaeota archaeon]
MKPDTLIKSKRGAISSTIADFWAYVTFVLVIMLFYLFFTYQAKGIEENKIKEDVLTINPNTDLLNYLKTPILIDGKLRIIADLIVISKNENDNDKRRSYTDELSKKTKEIMNRLVYCETDYGSSSKYIYGFAIFLLDEASYNSEIEFHKNYEYTSKNEDKKFRSDYFYDSQIIKKSFAVIPSDKIGQLIFVGLFVSSSNAADRQVQHIFGCA